MRRAIVMRLIEPLRLGSVCVMPIAVSSFVLESFDEEPPFMEDPGVQYARIRIAKTFRGDIEAKSTVEMLSVRAENGGAGYVAVERISGSVHGRSGSFALLHVGTMAGESQLYGLRMRLLCIKCKGEAGGCPKGWWAGEEQGGKDEDGGRPLRPIGREENWDGRTLPG